MAGPANVLQVVINGTNNAGPAFRSVATGAAAMGAAVTAAFAAAAVRAGQFERGLAEIGTLLDGDVRPAIGAMRSELMTMSVQFGQTLGAMTKARYDIVSAGFTDAAASADVLRESARLAIAGVSTVSQTADLLTTAINGLGLASSDASRVADVLFQIVRKGKTTMTDLSASMGPVFATARVAGVEIEELGAVMATLTANGVATAEAATALNALMRAIAAPTDEAAKALDSMGIDLSRGLIPALRGLSIVGEDGLRALAQFIPQIEALKAASAAAADIARLTDNMDAMNESAGQVNRAVGMMADTLPFKMEQLRAALDNIVVTIGYAMLPAAKMIAGALLEIAVMVRYLSTEAEDGRPRWASFIEELRKSSPVFDTIAKSVEWLAARVADMNKGLEEKAFNDRVTEKMRQLLDAGDIPQKPGAFGFGWETDLVALRAWAEELVKLEDAANPPKSTGTVIDELRDKVRDAYPELSAMLAQLRGDLASLMTPTQTTTPPRGGIVQSGYGAGGGSREPYGPPEPSKTPAATNQKDPEEQVNGVRDQVEELAKFTNRDLLAVALDVGSSFGDMFADIANGFLGLREGPIMIGRAIRSMAAQVIADLAAIIARMLVMQVLMAAFGAFLGAGTGGGTAEVGGGAAAAVPGAKSGFDVPGFGAADFPAVIMPGSPGLDRTPVLAAGGEMLIPRPRINAVEKMLRKVQSSPRQYDGGRLRGGAALQLNIQANRPFRTSEQNTLRDSVVESLARGERYSV